MRQVLPYSLWIGHAGDGSDYRHVLEAGIAAIVQLAAEEAPLQPPRELIYCRFPIKDSPGNDRKLLNLTIMTLANFLEQNVPTLVCCGGGMSRSPVLAAAALSLVYQESPDTCLEQVVAHAPADVLPGLWREVKGFLESERF